MLSLNLDHQTESYLVDILAKEKTNSNELMKRLIYEYWLNLQPRKTIAERLGGHPMHLLQDGLPDLSLRENRKKLVEEYIKKGNHEDPKQHDKEISVA